MPVPKQSETATFNPETIPDDREPPTTLLADGDDAEPAKTPVEDTTTNCLLVDDNEVSLQVRCPKYPHFRPSFHTH